MSAKTNNVRIGIFVLVAIALFIAGILAFGARSYFVKKTSLETAIVGEVYGLSVGSKVELRGVPVGKVSKIAFARNVYPKTQSDVVVVEFELEGYIFSGIGSAEQAHVYREEQVAKGLRAMIKGQGLTGTSILALEYFDPTNNPPSHIDYKPHHPYIPSVPGQVTRMLESIERSLRNLQKLDFEGIGLGVSNTLAKTTLLLDKLDRVDIEGVVVKVDTLLDGIKVAVAEVKTTIAAMEMETLSKNANGLVVGLKETNLKLQTVLDHVGDVPMQDTVGDIRSAIQTLNDVLVELKRYPSGFIFGDPPAPAKSVETPK